MESKYGIQPSSCWEQKNQEQKLIFTKYLASFAKNAARLNPSSHSLSPSVYSHSHHAMPLSSKSSQSLSANATFNHKPEMEEKK
jgi:hypothetical protein